MMNDNHNWQIQETGDAVFRCTVCGVLRGGEGAGCRPRSEAPGAAIKVERFNFTDEEREGLSINGPLPDLLGIDRPASDSTEGQGAWRYGSDRCAVCEDKRPENFQLAKYERHPRFGLIHRPCLLRLEGLEDVRWVETKAQLTALTAQAAAYRVANATNAMANDEWEEWQDLLTNNGFALAKADAALSKENG